MYLARIYLNLKKRKTKQALSQPKLFHGAIEETFKPKKYRNLWRIDSIGGKDYLMILSPEYSDFKNLIDQFGYKEFPAETKKYESFLDGLKEGEKWNFRIIANPTKDLSSASKRKTIPLASIEDQKNWLIQKGEKNGFLITENDFDVFKKQTFEFRKLKEKSKRKVTLFAVTYEGVLKIQDIDLFKKALYQGIGRGKAYGLGMLTIA